MKKKIIPILSILFYSTGFSQNVGINTTQPAGTLDIASKTSGIPIFRIAGSDNTNYFRIMPAKSFLISGTQNNSSYPISIYPQNDIHADFAIADRGNSAAFLKHYNRIGGNTELQSYGLNLSNIGIDYGHALVFSSGGQDSGLYIGTVSDVAGGIFIGENGYNGFGLSDKPTAKIDVGGGIRIGTTANGGTIDEGLACNRIGEISFNGHFWGCTQKGWKRLNN